jgi:hypothetical protein
MDQERGKDRYAYERPDFVYVRFKIDKESEENRERVLSVIDSSKTGLGMLITEKDSDLLQMLEKGDEIRDMAFFGAGLRIKEDGIVRHITKIKDGEYKGYYILGVYAPDITE